MGKRCEKCKKDMTNFAFCPYCGHGYQPKPMNPTHESQVETSIVKREVTTVTLFLDKEQQIKVKEKYGDLAGFKKAIYSEIA